MAKEIEHKYLVIGDAWKENASKTFYKQGYLSRQKERTVRVRIAENKAFLTIKGESKGASRAEYEYSIPLDDANEMLDNLCEKPLIEKYRYIIDYKGLTWEIDEFLGENEGLIVAEVELEHEEQEIELPDWVGQNVTHDKRYYNSNLAVHPFKEWK